MGKKILFLAIPAMIFFIFTAGFIGNDDDPRYDRVTGNETNVLYSQDITPPVYGVPLWDSPLAIVFNQDSLITHIGQGGSGANVSAIPTTANTLYGWGAQGNLGYWMADDFVIPVGQSWAIDSIKLYSYQTGSSTSSTITSSRCYITLGRVDSVGSQIVGGDTTSNRMIRTYWSYIYRTNNPPPYTTQTTRPIMVVTDTLNKTLQAGYYWVVYNFTGTLTSGPWNPPYTIWNQQGSGNARQKTTAWAPALDGTIPQRACFKIFGTVIVTNVRNLNNEIPAKFNLAQNYPNPFNPSTTINFSLPKSGYITLKVYNSMGSEVKTIVTGNKNAGNYTVDFNASNLSSGIYFYKLQADGFSSVKKMILVK